MRKITSFLVICAMLVTMLSGMVIVSAADIGTNAMAYGGFETNDGWYDVSSDFIYITLEEAKSGSRALALDGMEDHSQWTRAISTDVALDANSVYTISWYAKVDTENYALLYVYPTDNESAGILGVDGVAMGSSSDADWTYHEQQITTTSARSIRLGIKTKGNASNPCITYIDDIAVTKTAVNEFNPASPYADDVITFTNNKIPATLGSSTHLGNSSNIFDGNYASDSWGDGTRTWTNITFVADLGGFYEIEGYNLYGGNKTKYDDPYKSTDFGEWEDGDNVYRRMPIAWNLYYSLDGNGWTPLSSVTGNNMSLAQEDLSELEVVAKYIKYEQTGNFGNYCEWGCIREFEVFGSPTTVELDNHTVTFMVDDDVYTTSSVVDGSVASAPTNPAAIDYRFEGWYTESTLENAYDFSTPVTANITLYAKMTSTAWTNAKIPVTLVSSTNFNNANRLVDGNITSGSGSSGTKTWTNYTFVVDLGANYDLEGYNLYGGNYTSLVDPYNWTEHGSGDADPIAGNDNAYKRMPSAWNLYYSYDGIGWLPLTTVTGNTLSLVKGSLDGISARYIKYEQTGNFSYCEWGSLREFEVYGTLSTVELEEYTVTYYVNGEVYQEDTITEGFPPSAPEQPIAYGFSFVGWYTDTTFETPFDFTANITADTNVYAKMLPIAVVDLNEGHFINVPPTSVTHAPFPGDRVEKCNYYFNGGHAATNGGDNWLEIRASNTEFIADLGAGYTFDGFSTTTDPKCTFTLSASNDLENWTELVGEFSSEIVEYRTIPVAAGVTGSYRYVKLTITSYPGWSDWAGVKLYGVKDDTFAMSGTAVVDGCVTALFDNTTAEDVSGVVYVAVYGEDNELLSVASQDIEIEAGSTSVEFAQQISAVAGNRVAAFVVADKTGIKPIVADNFDTTI